VPPCEDNCAIPARRHAIGDERPDFTPESVLTDEVKSWIGRSTEWLPFPEEISASDVRRYVDATGDANPLWLDDELARSVGYKSRPVPPMMVLDLNWRLSRWGADDPSRIQHQVPLPPEYIDTRNAGLEIEWLAPVFIGDRLSVQHRITGIVARQGRRGLGVYLTRESEFRNQDLLPVVRTRQTVVRFPRQRYGAA